MAFVELTRKGGQKELVNVDSIVSVRDRAGENLPVVTFVSGGDHEVAESYEDVVAMLTSE